MTRRDFFQRLCGGALVAVAPVQPQQVAPPLFTYTLHALDHHAAAKLALEVLTSQLRAGRRLNVPRT
jgi:hypothetical protein